MADEKINIVVSLKNNAEKGLSSLTKGMGSLKDIALKVAKVALVALAAAVGKATLDFMKFEKGITNVYTLLNKGDFDKFGKALEKGALATMKKFGFGIEETNKALFDTVSAGVEASKAIKFLDVAGKLAVGGVTSISTAVDGLTSVMNAYGKENFDAARAANIFFVAQRAGKTNVDALASSIGKVAPIANAAGLTFQETAAAMSTLTLAGLSTEESTTAVRAILNSIINPSSQSAKAFKDMGIALVDTNGEMRPFGDILKDVEVATGGNVQKTAQLFPNIRAMGGAAAFASGKLGEYNKILNDVETDTEALDRAFKKQQKTLDRQRKILGSTIQTLGIQFASKFAPALQKVNDALIKMLKSEKVVALFSSLGKTLGFVITVVTKVAQVVGFLASGIWTLIKPLMPVIGFLAKAALAFGALAGAIILLANPITWVVASLGILGKAIDAIFKKIRGSTEEQINKTNSKIDELKGKLKELEGKELSEKDTQKKEDLTAKLAEEQAKKLELMASQEDEETALKLQKNTERNSALLEQEAAQREEKAAFDEELNAIKDEEELAAFEAKLVQNAERGKLTTAQEMAIEAKRSELKAANWKKELGTWMGIEKLKLVSKKSTGQKMNTFEDFMLGATKSKNKTAAGIAKAMAKKNIAMKTAEAAMSAFSGMSAIPIIGVPLGLIAAAAAISFGAEQMAAVDSGTAMAEGGVVMPSAGGTQATIGEAGSAEAVIPLDDPEAQSMMGGGDTQVDVYISGKPLAKEMYETQQEMIRTGELEA